MKVKIKILRSPVLGYIFLSVFALILLAACGKPGVGPGIYEGDKPEAWLDDHLFAIFVMKIGPEQLPISDTDAWGPCWAFLLREDLRENTNNALKNFCDSVIQLDRSYQGYKGLDIVRICDLPENEREAYAAKLTSARYHFTHEVIVGVGEPDPITPGDTRLYAPPPLKEATGLDCSKTTS